MWTIPVFGDDLKSFYSVNIPNNIVQNIWSVFFDPIQSQPMDNQKVEDPTYQGNS